MLAHTSVTVYSPGIHSVIHYQYNEKPTMAIILDRMIPGVPSELCVFFLSVILTSGSFGFVHILW